MQVFRLISLKGESPEAHAHATRHPCELSPPLSKSPYFKSPGQRLASLNLFYQSLHSEVFFKPEHYVKRLLCIPH